MVDRRDEKEHFCLLKVELEFTVELGSVRRYCELSDGRLSIKRRQNEDECVPWLQLVWPKQAV